MIKAEIKASIGMIILARPWADNALNGDMVKRLQKVLREWKAEPSLKVVLITGEGDSFSAGADSEEMHGLKKDARTDYVRQATDVLYELQTFPKPTVAALNGPAVAGGCELCLACDFRFAHEKVSLGLNHIHAGLTTGWGGTVRLLRLLPRSKALDLIFTGKQIDALTAHRWGLVDKMFPHEQFIRHVLAWCKQITLHSADALCAYKQTVLEHDDAVLDEEERINREVNRFLALWDTAAHQASLSPALKRGKKESGHV